MKTRLFAIALLLFCFTLIARGQSSEQDLEQAVSENNFFRIRFLLNDAKDHLAPEKFLYFMALSENKFDECALSNQHIEQIFKEYQQLLPDSLLLALLNTKVSNALRLCQYETAVQTSKQILKDYAPILDSIQVKSYENMLGLFGALSHIPPQEVTITKDETIAAHRNKFNHLMVPVKSKDTADFIFDSGAGLSTITKVMQEKWACG